jgi:two-component system chemotaxis response regulator CheY
MSDLTDSQRRVLPPRPDGKPWQFMIVDDSEFMVNNLKRILLSFGGEVLATAPDGANAILTYNGLTIKPDLITMDITMPKMNGIEATQAILRANAQQKIIVVSALGHKEAVQQAIMTGAKHFVVKPFQRDDVYRVLRAVLNIPMAEGES